MTGFQKRLWLGLVIMALLSPLGIILPQIFNSENAWGEWSTETLLKLIGYVPDGLKRYADIWKAPIAGYNLGGEGSSLAVRVISYVFSALIGIVIVAAFSYLVSRLFSKNEK